MEKTPALAVAEKGPETPFWDDVIARYDPSKERIREQHYARDKKVASRHRNSAP